MRKDGFPPIPAERGRNPPTGGMVPGGVTVGSAMEAASPREFTAGAKVSTK